MVMCGAPGQHEQRQRGGRGGGQLPSMPYALPQANPPVVVRKNYMCPFDPFRPSSQRKVYVKIHEMCQNTAQ